MVDTGADPSQIMEEHQLRPDERSGGNSQNSSQNSIAQNPEKVAEIKAGKLPLVKWFVGVVMKSTEGRANPEAAEQEIKKQLGV
jgi:aspartyl-tRNA(Asn)/glutamyl-tRNA(Gln) amidotransferase subunit B